MMTTRSILAIKRRGKNRGMEKMYSTQQKKINLAVVGVGGAGCNIVNGIVEKGIENFTTVAIDTDAQVLSASKSDRSVQIGTMITNGNGAGSSVAVGLSAVKESEDDVQETLSEYDAVFIVSGLGGGTGTGAVASVAEWCQDKEKLTMGIFVMPFEYEGKTKMDSALNGLEMIRAQCNSYIVVPNIVHDMSYIENLDIVNNMIFSQLNGISDVIEQTGRINLDFSDLSLVLRQGRTVILSGTGTGEDATSTILSQIMSSPLLQNINIKSSTHALVSIVGTESISGCEIKEICTGISEHLDKEINFFHKIRMDDNMEEGNIKVMLFLSGLEEKPTTQPSKIHLPTIKIPSWHLPNPLKTIPSNLKHMDQLLGKIKRSRWW